MYILWVHVHFFCDTYIRGGFRSTIYTWGGRGYIVSHMVIGLLETVSVNSSLSFEIWVEIQVREVVGLLVLKMDGEDLE